MGRKKFAAYAKAYPELAAEFKRRVSGELPTNWAAESKAFIENYKQIQRRLQAVKHHKMPLKPMHTYCRILGGSADLASSNNLMVSKPIHAHENVSGNYINYGVREFGMSAIMNGIALHGGFIPYGATFLMFYEYAHNAVRMALMKQRTLFVYTHDSIGLGEDGPTHQPVEQTASLRLIPNLETWRPCDQVESAIAWQQAVERQDGPSALIFTRQNLAQMNRTSAQLDAVKRGVCIKKDCDGTPELIFIATGSEWN